MNKHQYNIKTSFKYIFSLSMMFLFCLTFFITKAKAIDACTSNFPNPDNSTILLITPDYSLNVLKGNTIVVLINNNASKDAVKYNVNIFKDGSKSVLTKSGQLDGASGKNTVYQDGIPTAKWDAGSYLVKVDIIHPTVNCIIKTTNFSFSLTTTASDVMPSTGVQTGNNGDFVVSSDSSKIGVGDTFTVQIQNNSSAEISYELTVNDLKTGAFLRKRAGSVKAGQKIGDWAQITTAGDHIARINLYEPTSRTLLYSQDFAVNVAVGNNPNIKASASDPPATETETTSSPGEGASSAVLADKTTAGNNQPVTESTNGEVNPSIGEIFKGIFIDNDATNANLDSVNLIIKKVLDYAFNFAGIVAFVMVLWAARMFFNSYGSDESAAMGKKTLIWAFVGLCVIFISKGILVWLYMWMAR